MIEHGAYKLEHRNQLLIVRAIGSWNLETSESMCIEYREIVNKIMNKPWACLVDLSKWELCTPDIWQPIGETNSWANVRNQKFEAVVCSSSIAKALLENSEVVLTNVESDFFRTEESALKWLKEKQIIFFD